MIPLWWQPFTRDIACWWLACVVLGWLVFPLVFRAVPGLADRGFGVSRVIGLTLTTLFGSWLRYSGVLAGGLLVDLVACGVVGAFAFVLAAPVLREVYAWLRIEWRRVLVAEALWLACFLGFLWMRSWFPHATHDIGWYAAEKWPNMAMLSSMVRHPVVPPVDPFLGGLPLNYYYFSHLTWAQLARLTAVTPSVAFNLSLATLFACLCLAARTAGEAVSDRRAGGWWTFFLVVFAGPLAAWQQVGKLAATLRGEGLSAMLRGFDFWATSDIVPNTRNEFPAFNWLLGDLHAHGWGVVLLLVGVVLLVQAYRAAQEGGGWRRGLKAHLPTLEVGVLLVGAMWMTNGWDVLVLMLLAILVVLATGARAWSVKDAARVIGPGVLGLVVCAWVAIALVAAFYSSNTVLPLEVRHPMLAELPGPLAALGSLGVVSVAERSTLSMLLWFWGFPLVAGGVALVLDRLRDGRHAGTGWNHPALAAGVAAVFVGILIWSGPDRRITPVVLLVAGVAGCLWVILSEPTRRDTTRWAALLGGAAMLLVLVAELVYVDDPIGPPYQRYNTVFKLWYPAWVLAALAVATLLARLRVDMQGGRMRWAVVGCMAFILVAGGFYPVAGVAGRVLHGAERIEAHADAPEPLRTLDALAYLHLDIYAPDDAALGAWMAAHLPRGTDVWSRGNLLAEAPGESYAFNGRFTVMTGVPGFLVWPSHLTQWRGGVFGELIWPVRSEALQVLYETEAPDVARAVCDEHGIRWVVVGSRERALFSAKQLAKFQEAGRLAHRAGSAELFDMRSRVKSEDSDQKP